MATTPNEWQVTPFYHNGEAAILRTVVEDDTAAEFFSCKPLVEVGIVLDGARGSVSPASAKEYAAEFEDRVCASLDAVARLIAVLIVRGKRRFYFHAPNPDIVVLAIERLREEIRPLDVELTLRHDNLREICVSYFGEESAG